MSEVKRGYIVAVLVHLLILGPFYLSGHIFSEKKKVKTLDIGFSFHLSPLGNTLERPAFQSEKTPKKNLHEETKEDGGIGEPNPDPSEMRYGVSDGMEGVDEFYITENYRAITGVIHNRLLYPKIARTNGWQGKVMVSFVIHRDGSVGDIRIEKSSGYAILDNSAIKTIRSIQGLPKPENSTRITLPISFVLRES